MTKRKQPERQFQKAAVQFLWQALPEDSFITSIPGGNRGVTTTPGYVSGFPDILCFIPNHKPFLFECKSKVGSLTDVQAKCHVRLLWAGAKVVTVKTLEDIQRALIANSIPLRGSIGGSVKMRDAA